MNIDEIETVKKVTLGPNDKIIIRVVNGMCLSQEGAERIKKMVKEWAGENVPVLVLGQELELSILENNTEAG